MQVQLQLRVLGEHLKRQRAASQKVEKALGEEQKEAERLVSALEKQIITERMRVQQQRLDAEAAAAAAAAAEGQGQGQGKEGWLSSMMAFGSSMAARAAAAGGAGGAGGAGAAAGGGGGEGAAVGEQ